LWADKRRRIGDITEGGDFLKRLINEERGQRGSLENYKRNENWQIAGTKTRGNPLAEQ